MADAVKARWFEMPETERGVIISSRVRLARNLNDYPFSLKINEAQSARLLQEVTGAVARSGAAFAYIDLSAAQDARALLERHIISSRMLESKAPRAVLAQPDESLSIMLNEEDHIRVQAIAAGSDIDAAWRAADSTDDMLEAELDYAFNSEFGYLTSCPTNTGTGLRASFMIHLPALEKTGGLKAVLTAIAKFGMTIRGTYGEGSEVMGSVYQVSNQLTLGKSEAEIIAGLKSVTDEIIRKENLLAQRMLAENRLELEDRAHRAYGILTNCKKVNTAEAMEMLSVLRFARVHGFLDMPAFRLNTYNIMMNIQPGNLQKIFNRDLNEAERDLFRAEYLRNVLQ